MIKLTVECYTESVMQPDDRGSYPSSPEQVPPQPVVSMPPVAPQVDAATPVAPPVSPVVTNVMPVEAPLGNPADVGSVPPNIAQPAAFYTAPTEVPVQAFVEPAAPYPEPADALGGAVSWQASEYIHHEKDRIWFVLLFVAGLVLAVVAFFLLSITFALLIAVMTVVLAVFAVRQPRIVSYQLTDSGIQINDKHFAFQEFRTFGVLQDGPLYSAVLTPNKRFMPAVTLYFPSEDGDEIVAILGSYLPMNEIEADPVDKLMRHMRF